MEKKVWKRKTAVLSIAILLVLIVRMISVFYIPGERQFTPFLSLIWIAYSFLFVFISNYAFNWILNYILPWKKYASWRFACQLFFGTLISLGCLNLSYALIKDQFTSAPPDPSQILLLNIYGFAMILPVFALYFGMKFLKAWKKSELEAERLQKENARSQMKTLRNHLDPHFLFNNLNILSSLIDHDSELSKTYLDKFAEVYRIILRADTGDLTTLEEEMKLIDSYMYLLKIRFKDSIIFTADIDPKHKETVIPPLSIQMLVENALKHNVASTKQPIEITIHSIDGDYIRIQNNIQKKKFMPAERKGTGLDNIKRRYAYFTDKDIVINEGDHHFIVDLPLMHIDFE